MRLTSTGPGRAVDGQGATYWNDGRDARWRKGRPEDWITVRLVSCQCSMLGPRSRHLCPAHPAAGGAAVDGSPEGDTE